jgi:hypothetical protein
MALAFICERGCVSVYKSTFYFVLMALCSSHALAMLRCMDRLSDVVFLRWNSEYTITEFSKRVEVLRVICKELGLTVGITGWNSVPVTFRNNTAVSVQWPSENAYLDLAAYGNRVIFQAMDKDELKTKLTRLSEDNFR